ncbi:MAG: hypothetical protein F3745_05470 [Nitrospinae bacterium]|nr:hypothetical protein [Nitrospinota bacterium]
MNLTPGLKHTRIYGLVVTILLLSQFGVSAPVKAQEKVKFFSFEFTVVKLLRGYPQPVEIEGQPVSSQHAVEALLSGPSEGATFRLVEADDEDETLQTIDLIQPIKEKDPGFFNGTIEVPEEPFRVAVSGVDLHGRPFNLVYPKIFRRQSLEVLFRVENYKKYSIKHGQMGTFTANVINHGEAGTFSLEATARPEFKTDSLSFNPISRVAPATLNLGTDESGTFEIDITIPAETTGADIITLTATAKSSTRPEIQNSSEINISFAKPSSFSLVPEIYKARIRVHPVKGSFEIQGRLNLDPESDGIDPAKEEVRVSVRNQLEGYVETIPSGTFVEKRKKFVYRQKGNPGIRKMALKKNGRFEIIGKGLDTSMMDITGNFSLSIGIRNDRGTGGAQLRKRGENLGVFHASRSKDKDKDKDKDRNHKKRRGGRR